MKLDVDEKDLRVTKGSDFKLKNHSTALKKVLYKSKKDYCDRLGEYQEEIDDLQSMMYAHDRYGALLIFQAMDAAGKDGTIKHVMSGVNPHGVKVHAFKQPSIQELDHDFLWRTSLRLPERGTIAIFNRSYYEEVIVCKVHSKIVTDQQRLPREKTKSMKRLWQKRYRSIRDLEKHLIENGIIVLKFFLNISKEEQRQRFLSRIDEPEKHWKFSEGDVRERDYWDAYMEAYETCIRETATKDAPWYVIPADDKESMRLMVAKIVLNRLSQLALRYPVVTDERRESLRKYREILESEA